MGRTNWRLAVVSLTTAMALVIPAATAGAVIATRPAAAMRLRPSSAVTLARAPSALRRAVARSLGPSLHSQELLGGGDAIDFGYSVAISGTTALVGTPGNVSMGGPDSAALVYTESDGVWSQQASLRTPGSSGADSVALSGTTAVIGQAGNTGGSVFIFSGSGASWSEQATFTTSHVAGFGSAVAVSGATVLVGADGGSFGDPGSAFVLTESAGTWSEQAELTASSSWELGFSVALSGTTALIGAPGTDDHAGAAYVFTQSAGTWSQQAELTTSSGAPDPQFGYSVALSGTTALIGAPFASSAYVFTASGGLWSAQATLSVPGGPFGYSVALSGTIALIGDTNSDDDAGGAYVFTETGGVWAQRADLPPPAQADGFGCSVALWGQNEGIIGAFGKGTNGDGLVVVYWAQ